MSGINAVALFMISVFFKLIFSVLWLRIALSYLKISSLNPISQVVHRLSDPLLKPLHLILKSRPLPRYDYATFIAILILEFFKILCLSLLTLHGLLPFFWFVIYALADLIIQPCDLLFYALIIRIVMNFVDPNSTHPIVECLVQITNPLIKIGRKIIPNISGFDFSPFIMLMIFKIITLFIASSLPINFL